MAKRKNKKTRSKDAPQAQLKAQKTSQEAASASPGQVSSGNRVSIPVFFSGMFLTLVLGLYLGTLIPEMMAEKAVEPEKAQAPLAAATSETPPRKPAAPETSPNAQADSAANLSKDVAAHVGHLKAELAQHPDSVKTWIELGDLYFDSGNPKLSIEAYGRALALDPGNPDVLTDMGIMYREMGEFNKALECFRNANSIKPGHTQSLYNQGLILSHDLNDKAGAIEAWEALLKVSPDAISPNGKPVRKMLEELQ